MSLSVLPVVALGSVLALGLSASAAATRSAQEPADARAPGDLELRVEAFQLENGWRFLLLPRPGPPVVSFETWVDTGSRHDHEGARGSAHLLMNLLFKGTERVGSSDWLAERAALEELDAAEAQLASLGGTKDLASLRDARERRDAALAAAAGLSRSQEFTRLFEDAGAGSTLNAYTRADGTRFVVSLPSNQVELWCWLESDRFMSPALRDFHTEREAVLESLLGRASRGTHALLEDELLQLAYVDHPYRYRPVGYREDLSRLTRGELRADFASGYGARHMTTAIVGDFDVARVMELVERYFARVPAGPRREWRAPEEPPQTTERRIEVPADAPPEVLIGWHAPSFSHADAPALHLGLRLLATSRSSRLERRLEREGGLASAVELWPVVGGDELRSLVALRLVPLPGVSTARLEELAYEEIERLASEGPTPEELRAAQRAGRAEHLRGLRDDASLARGLVEHDAKGGDWHGLFRVVERVNDVSAAEVQRVIRAYLGDSRRNVVTLVPRASQAGEGASR